MIRTLVWFVYFWLHLIVLSPLEILAKHYIKKGEIDKARALAYKYVAPWARALLKIAGVKIEVTGLENIPKDETVVFVSNHQGNFDIPILLASLDKPYSMMAKKEIKKIPLVAGWMETFQCVFVDRQDVRKSMQALNEGIEIVKNGHSMVIFPEGTRSKGGPVGEFKAGSFRIAAKTGVPLVPIVINGSHKIMEANKNIIKSGVVKLTILPKVETTGLSKEDIKALPEQIREQIVSNM